MEVNVHITIIFSTLCVLHSLVLLFNYFSMEKMCVFELSHCFFFFTHF